MTNNTSCYFYAIAAQGDGGLFEDSRLTDCIDRHRLSLERPALSRFDVKRANFPLDVAGVVIELKHGWPSLVHLRLARVARRKISAVWFYWRYEGAIERIDDERLQSYWRLWMVVHGRAVLLQGVDRIWRLSRDHLPERARAAVVRAGNRVKAQLLRAMTPRQTVTRAEVDLGPRVVDEYERIVERLCAAASPAAFGLPVSPSPTRPLDAAGAYLRTDFWARINTGGSYGHTCYVAKELARTTTGFVCYMPVRYLLLDELALRQVVLPSPGPTNDELALIRANGHYHEILGATFARERPAFLYERLCLGNFTGARLSHELRIPYIVEYNGSEISMRRSFGSGAYEHESFFLKAELAAFRQATMISVVSEAVRDDVVRRGIDPARILVNPNGVDLETYRPPSPAERANVRSELGFTASDRVVGFIGTFGGWHGVDVLAAALPKLCERSSQSRFLLIGDGEYRARVDKTVRANGLSSQVFCTGRVPHQEGARLLRACDIYVSPHSSHMVDSRFFGSPTKLFEYMGLGGAIVASDLEQIGEVLRPALHARALPSPQTGARNMRAILCKPGDVDEFVEAVDYLIRNPSLCEVLGANARAAAEREFGWNRHIERLWQFVVARVGQQ